MDINYIVQENHATVHRPKEDKQQRRPKGGCMNFTRTGNKREIRDGWKQSTEWERGLIGKQEGLSWGG